MRNKRIRSGFLLPFNTQQNKINIIQGFNGPHSHMIIEVPGEVSKDLRYAVDFALPVGTKIYAAKAGRYQFVSGNRQYYTGEDVQTGIKTKANFVSIEHADGTISIYSHLAYEKVLLNNADVQVGEYIGKTGMSGWVGKFPHLHFMVINPKTGTSLPFTFENFKYSLEHDMLFPAV